MVPRRADAALPGFLEDVDVGGEDVQPTCGRTPAASEARAPRADSARTNEKHCFVSIGDFDVPHQEASARQSEPSDSSTEPWNDDRFWFDRHEGLNTFGYKASIVTSVGISRADVRTGRTRSFECAGGQLYRLRVPVPDGARGYLRIRANSPGHTFEMQVRTGGDACEGVHRIVVCDPLRSGGYQCEILFDDGQVDNSDFVIVELFSKTDARIDFRAQ
ncbi:hypothetical protein [Pararobbsia alpina]|uniref:hypothetical protein n=1 Tax=Pararobbsia alpina TaxID=621374 RepID=UPI0039A78669